LLFSGRFTAALRGALHGQDEPDAAKDALQKIYFRPNPLTRAKRLGEEDAMIPSRKMQGEHDETDADQV
jgi:hypothetical protein